VKTVVEKDIESLRESRQDARG